LVETTKKKKGSNEDTPSLRKIWTCKAEGCKSSFIIFEI